MKLLSSIAGFAAVTCLISSVPPSFAVDEQKGSVSVDASLSQAEQWVKNRSMPDFVLQDQEEKKQAKPFRSFVKHVAKGTASEVSARARGMAQDLAFICSVQDNDPYERTAPTNRPARVLKFTMIDGSTAYLRRFPDNSFAIEDGFADGTVMQKGADGNFVVKYPNGVSGRVVFQGRNTILVYRPDQTITTFQKNMNGGYSINNDKLGYMGTARPDTTGVNYEIDEMEDRNSNRIVPRL